MPGGLELATQDDDLGDDAPLGGLERGTGDPSGAVTWATRALREQARDSTTSGTGVDAYAQRANGAYPTWAEMRQRMEQELAAQAQAGRTAMRSMQNPAIDRSLPWLRAAAGLMGPTKTGSFGESLGKGVEGYATGREEQNKQELDFSRRAAEMGYGIAKDRTTAVEGMLKLGMSAEQIEAALAMMKNRLAAQRFKILPTRGLVDLMAPGGPQMVKGLETLSLAQLQTQIQKNIDRYIAQNKVFTDPAQADAERTRLYGLATQQLSTDPDSVFARLTKPGGLSMIGLPEGATVSPDAPGPAAAPAAAGAPPAPAAAAVPAPGADGQPPAPVPAASSTVPATGSQPGVFAKGSPQLGAAVKGAETYASGIAKSRNEFEDELVAEKRNAVNMNRSLDELQDSIQHGKPGVGAALFAAIAKLKLQAGIGSERDKEIAGSFEEADKVSGGLASNFVKSISGRPTQFEFIAALSRFVPGMDQTPAGSKKVIEILRQINNVAATQPNEYYSWREKNPQGDHRRFVSDFWDRVSKMPLSTETPYGGGAAPEGVPAGSKKVGFAKGTRDEVWEAPDKSRFVIKAH